MVLDSGIQFAFGVNYPHFLHSPPSYFVNTWTDVIFTDRYLPGLLHTLLVCTSPSHSHNVAVLFSRYEFVCAAIHRGVLIFRLIGRKLRIPLIRTSALMIVIRIFFLFARRSSFRASPHLRLFFF